MTRDERSGNVNGARPVSDPAVIRAALSGMRMDPELSDAAVARITAAAITAKRAQIAARRAESPWRRFIRLVLDFDATRLGGWALPTLTGAAAVLALAFAAYLVMGGSVAPGSAVASSAGPFEVRQRRTALFVSWHANTLVPGGETSIGPGDVIAAAQPVTLTFADGTVVVAKGGSEFGLLTERPGLELRNGEVSASADGGAAGADGSKFTVVTRRGTYRDLGTVFRARSGEDEDYLATDAGRVQAAVRVRSGDLLRADVRAREELVIPNNVSRLEVQLQEPSARVLNAAGDAVAPGGLTASRRLSVTGTAYPGGLLEITGGLAPVNVRLGADGQFAAPVTLPDGPARLKLTIRSDDGRSRSTEIAFTVDSVAPPLAAAQRDAGAGRVGFAGKTEPGAVVTANGVAVTVGADGAFAGELPAPAGGVLTVLARDAAGNQSVAVIVIR